MKVWVSVIECVEVKARLKCFLKWPGSANNQQKMQDKKTSENTRYYYFNFIFNVLKIQIVCEN